MAVCNISLNCNSLDSKDQEGRLRKATAFKDHFWYGISSQIALVQLKLAYSFHSFIETSNVHHLMICFLLHQEQMSWWYVRNVNVSVDIPLIWILRVFLCCFCPVCKAAAFFQVQKGSCKKLTYIFTINIVQGCRHILPRPLLLGITHFILLPDTILA